MNIKQSCYDAVATELTLLSDQQLFELLDTAMPMGVSIGGTTSLLRFNGTNIFVKKIPLTDIERRPENIMSTANLFNLPTYCQYGIRSPGFGVWRELAAHTMSTNWVLTGECPNFPLMYHWRMLPRRVLELPTAEQLKEVEREVDYWEGSPTVRERLLTRLTASADIVLFLEYIPEDLHQWLRNQIVKGGVAAESACTMVANNLKAVTAFMNSRGLIHFDAHFKNLLTDGQRLYFSDFGLATSVHFNLSEVEADFFQQHHNFDHCYTMAYLVQTWIRTELFGVEIENWLTGDYNTALHEYATGKGKPLAPAIEAIIMPYIPIAVVMNKFFQNVKKFKMTPYPTDELERLSAEISYLK